MMERRINAGEFSLRGAFDGKTPPTIIGYASVFDSPSKDLGGFVEVIKPGAFTKSIRSGREVRAYYNHEPNMMLGTLSAGTLSVEEDKHGLRYEVKFPDTSYARDLAELIERGDVRHNSFAFVPIKDEFRSTKNGYVREVIEAELHDVSIVNNPAYESAKIVDSRSFDEWVRQNRRDIDYVNAVYRHLSLSPVIHY